MTESADLGVLLLQRYGEAVRNKDVEALMALYDDDVHVFDMWGSWSLRGISAWRAMAQEWFAGLGTDQVTVTSSEVHTTTMSELAIGHAILTYTARSVAGTVLRSLDNRITFAMKRTATSWVILHQHTSVPIDDSSLKGILRMAN